MWTPRSSAPPFFPFLLNLVPVPAEPPTRGQRWAGRPAPARTKPAAIAFAPLAAADNGIACKGSSLASVCQKNGHSSIVATPGQSRAGNWPFGPSGGPVIAILG